MDQQGIRDEGRQCGEQPECLAADCPYLPPAQLAERNLWMVGFGQGRETLSAADFRPTRKPIYEPHAG